MSAIQLTVMKFPLGQAVITRAAQAKLEQLGLEPGPFLQRHASGDWGEVSASDAAANNAAIDAGHQILSNYPLPSGSLWVLTEWDRSTTTVLLPSDY